jgi:hypothetical protein
MIDFNEAAESLYPNQTSSTESTPNAKYPSMVSTHHIPQPLDTELEDEDFNEDFDDDDLPIEDDDYEEAQSSHEITVESIDDAIPDSIKELRNESIRKLYSAQKEFAEAIPDSLFDSAGLDYEVQEVLSQEIREMAMDVGMNSSDIPDIITAMSKPPLTPVQRISARETAVTLLNNEFGPGAKQALRDARAFVQQDPRRNAMLQSIGDDPTIVLKVARLARVAKMSGKL